MIFLEVQGVRGWLEADDNDPEVEKPKDLFWPRCPSEREPVKEACKQDVKDWKSE